MSLPTSVTPSAQPEAQSVQAETPQRGVSTDTVPVRAAVLHGAGYAGGELLALLLAHPLVTPTVVTSRSQAGQPIWTTHARLRGQTDLVYADPAHLGMADRAPEAEGAGAFDVAFVCAEHGQGAAAVRTLRQSGFDKLIIDLSADHRLGSVETYERVYGLTHPAPDAMRSAVYGLTEVNRDWLPGATLVANPGCFASGIALALKPLADAIGPYHAHVTALTGASGSGARPSATTHYPTRDGNVRAYKPLAHRHLAEVQETLGADATVRFVPVSGPWTRGIWGTAHVALPDSAHLGDVTESADSLTEAVSAAFEAAYGDAPLVRMSPDILPELKPVVGTPFFDVGWVVKDGHLVVGFALDNLLKGAASQAVQNLNLVLGWPEALGLLPGVSHVSYL